jgi:hypothetical protein
LLRMTVVVDDLTMVVALPWIMVVTDVIVVSVALSAKPSVAMMQNFHPEHALTGLGPHTNGYGMAAA